MVILALAFFEAISAIVFIEMFSNPALKMPVAWGLSKKKRYKSVMSSM